MEITEVCPEGATITETITECVATMTRSICQTSATNYPCYPCIMGSPASSEDTATVTVTSCSASTEPTVTITVQLCSTCTTSTYIGTVPGYTPGGPCHDCTSYQPSSSSPPLPPSPTVETITATATATATVIDSTGCTESETRPPTNSPQAPSPPQESVSQPQTASPEPTTDNTPNSVATATPHLPSTTESAPSPPEPTDTIPGRPSLTSGAPSSSGLPEAPQPEGYSYLPPPEGLTSSETAPAPSNTPHLPTAVPPPAVVTAGGAKNMAGLGVAVVGVLMGALLGI
ncbi:hypothetical protein B0T22DRAFT_441257 [Podospora appendiculata]|uniref:Uncharacterized protein n=1 Tax=Podospora appendiculata TaxID=314037 RepID=A0AAE0XC01_9PEZI|nr:hypothetical protein B0T22DRAFT_441257 [Podospora appendiculata]